MTKTCFHCGEPIPNGFHAEVVIHNQAQPMCCVGCQAVAQTIVDNNLTDYYKFRTEPAQKSTPLVPEELTQHQVFDEQNLQGEFTYTDGDYKETILSIEGISCAACAWLIEMQLQKLAGIQSIKVNATTQRATVRWQNQKIKLSNIIDSIRHIGYQASPFKANEQEQLLKKRNKNFVKRLGISGILMMQVMMIAFGMYFGAFSGIEQHNEIYLRWISFILTIPVVSYGALPFYQGAINALKIKQLSMDVPVALAIILAFLASTLATFSSQGEVYFESVCMFTFLLLVGKYLEFRARNNAATQSANILKMMPITACKLNNNELEYVAAKALQADDKVLVKPGEVIPADGIVIEGNSYVNEAMLSGEQKPIQKNGNDTVYAGTVNGDGKLMLKVLHNNQQSFIHQIIQLSESAQHHKPKVALVSDKIAQFFVAAILIIAGLTAVYWYQIDPSHAFWITISVLVATCPCALSLATPTALTCATTKLNRLGILIKSGDALETLAQVNAFAFDKTGTLTEGNLKITRIDIDSEIDKTQLLDQIATIEQHSEHPISKAFTSYYSGQFQAKNIKVQSGCGITASIDEQNFKIGKPSWFQQALSNEQQTASCIVSINEQIVASIYVEDKLRNGTTEVISNLKKAGIKTILVSGDNQHNCQQLAQYLAFDEVNSALSANQKLDKIKQLQQHYKVAMVGDGVNDSPVLAQAHVAIAMGSGTEISKNGADVILLNNKLSSITTLRKLAHKTKGIIFENYTWAFLYNLVVLPLAVSGALSPYMAVVGMSFSSLLVVSNSLRLLK